MLIIRTLLVLCSIYEMLSHTFSNLSLEIAPGDYCYYVYNYIIKLTELK